SAFKPCRAGLKPSACSRSNRSHVTVVHAKTLELGGPVHPHVDRSSHEPVAAVTFGGRLAVAQAMVPQRILGSTRSLLLHAIGLRVLGVESSCIAATQRSSALCRIATGVDCSKATSTCNRYEPNSLLPFNSKCLQSREDTESRRPACTSATWSSVCVPAKLQALRQPAAWQCVVVAGLPWASYSAMVKAWLEPTPPGGCSHQGSWSWALPHHIQSAQPSFTLQLARESAGRWLRRLASQHALRRAAAAATGWLLAKRLRTEPEPFEAEFDDDELEGGEFEGLTGGVIFADVELGSSFPDLEPLVLPPLEDLDEAEDAMDDVLDGPRPKKKETAS
ncbi:hypothetical protein HaLaN_24963, partial [Haematococcus lacustris]